MKSLGGVEWFFCARGSRGCWKTFWLLKDFCGFFLWNQEVLVEKIFFYILRCWTIFSGALKNFFCCVEGFLWSVQKFSWRAKVIRLAAEFESSKIFAVGQAFFWGAGGVLAAEKFIGHLRIFLLCWRILLGHWKIFLACRQIYLQSWNILLPGWKIFGALNDFFGNWGIFYGEL